MLTILTQMADAAPDNARGARWGMLALLSVCRGSLGFQFQTLSSIADPLVSRFGFVAA
jgi:hypothetical protein